MHPHLILRVHIDLRSGLGHAARALAIHEAWKAMGGAFTLAVSGDERARRIGEGRHPFADGPLPFPVVDLGGHAHASLTQALKDSAAVILLDVREAGPGQVQELRPLKVAVLEDDGDAHEHADVLFQPYLEGIVWPDAPVKVVNGRKVRPFETAHGPCRVLRGAAFIVAGPTALRRRPKREPLQPLAVHKLLVDFGGEAGRELARRAHAVLAAMVKEGRWTGTCTLLAPHGVEGTPFPGCQVLAGLPDPSARLQDHDAVWCCGGTTLADALCLGVPAATWALDERQHLVTGDIALANGCYDLGIGVEASPEATMDALEQWLGPEGQETRQEQTRDGMRLVDGMGAGRIAQELWALATR